MDFVSQDKVTSTLYSVLTSALNEFTSYDE